MGHCSQKSTPNCIVAITLLQSNHSALMCFLSFVPWRIEDLAWQEGECPGLSNCFDDGFSLASQCGRLHSLRLFGRHRHAFRKHGIVRTSGPAPAAWASIPKYRIGDCFDRPPSNSLKRNARPWSMSIALKAAALGFMLTVPAGAQTCNSLTGSGNCGTGSQIGSYPAATATDDGRSTQYRRFQSLGSDLSFAGEQPATLGAITFSGGSRQCSGLFRTSRC